MQVVGLTGSLPKNEVEMVMNDSGIMKLEMCLGWIYTKRDYIFGEIKVHFEVLPTGKIRKVDFASSTIGDLEFEKCLVKKFSYIKFPKPKGGGTEVDYSYTIDVPTGTREPDSIASPMVEKALEEFKGDMKGCVGKSLRGLTLIAYLGETYSEETVVPGKKKKKKKLVEKDFCHVLALSGTLPEGADEDAMQCILNASKSWKIPLDAGTYVSKGKVSY